MLRLVGLYGPSRSGKDTIARILRDDFGFEQRAMADRIREILVGLDPLLEKKNGDVVSLAVLFHECDGDWDLIKKQSPESVDYMIRLGQTCRDVLGSTVWLDPVLPAAESTAKICISDVRQPNEYLAIRQRGGKIWKVTREGASFRGMDGLLDGYEFDATINNRGSPLDLRGVVQATVAATYQNVRIPRYVD